MGGSLRGLFLILERYEGESTPAYVPVRTESQVNRRAVRTRLRPTRYVWVCLGRGGRRDLCAYSPGSGGRGILALFSACPVWGSDPSKRSSRGPYGGGVLIP